MNTQRIAAIFEKDLKDFMKNMMMLMMPVIPIILALIYNRIGTGLDEGVPIEMVYLIVGVIFASVTTSCMMTMMAEENEKKTLRGLMLSPASFLDIIIGKSLVTGLMSFFTLIISLAIVGIEPILNVRAIIGLVLIYLFFLFIGIGIGLFSKSLAATSAYLMPVMFLFGFTPMIEFLGLAEDSMAMGIANVFPIMQLIAMHDSSSWFPLAIVLVWVLAAGLFMYICFKKTIKDK